MSESISYLPFVTPFVVTLALTFLFLYLCLTYRSKFLIYWTLAWFFWALRIGLAVVYQDMQFSDSSEIFVVGLVVIYTTFILLGSAELNGQKVLGKWLLIAFTTLLVRAIAFSLDYVLVGIIISASVLSGAWIWAGIMFVNSGINSDKLVWIPGASLMGMGILQLSLIFFAFFPALSFWAPSITLVFQLGIAVGVLILFNQDYRNQLAESHAALEEALTKVLSGFIPICANCNSIRDENDEWQSIERYISAKTEAKFSHGICRSCSDELYPTLRTK